MAENLNSSGNHSPLEPVERRQLKRKARVLYVHLPVSPASVSEQRVASKSKRVSHLESVKSSSQVHHTVKRGETLYSIANNYNTSVEAIKQTNAHAATIRPGMVLVIPE